jgi:hypothetical protein
MIHGDGYWLAFGKTGQRYEVGEIGRGKMLLNICGVRRLEGDTTDVCKQWAEDHNNDQA